eukprot:5903921-Prymnesium_polylepis.1
MIDLARGHPGRFLRERSAAGLVPDRAVSCPRTSPPSLCRCFQRGFRNSRQAIEHASLDIVYTF